MRDQAVRLRSPAAALLTFLTVSLAAPAVSQEFPNRTARIFVGNPPGGSVDLVARVLADGLTKSFGHQFIVENRTGANGNIAVEAMMRSPADGHTMLVAAPGPFVTHGNLYAQLPYDMETAFTPISLLARLPLILVATPKLPVSNVNELIQYAKANPGKLSYGSQGSGSMGHLAMELFKIMAGVDAVHIPYKGAAPAVTDLMAGVIHLSFDPAGSSLPRVRSGGLKALAVGELARLKVAPDIPTVAETGIAGFEAAAWVGLAVRSGTPNEIVKKLAAAIRPAVMQPEAEARLSGIGIDLVASSPAEFEKLIREDTVKWARVIKQSGARVD